MDGLKNAIMSRGIWGGFVTVGIGVATFFGMQTPDCSPEILAEYDTCQQFISEKLYGIVIGVAGAVAMVGRWLAKKQLTLF